MSSTIFLFIVSFFLFYLSSNCFPNLLYRILFYLESIDPFIFHSHLTSLFSHSFFNFELRVTLFYFLRFLYKSIKFFIKFFICQEIKTIHFNTVSYYYRKSKNDSRNNNFKDRNFDLKDASRAGSYILIK